MPRRIALLVACLLASLTATGVAHAAPFDPLGFQFQSPLLVVHENAGSAVIAVQRSPLESAAAAQVRYIALGTGLPCGAVMCTAISPYDFGAVKGEVDFAAGQTGATFSVPIVDHGVNTVPKTVQVSLFGPSSWPDPIGLATPSTAVLTILNDDAVATPSLANPLASPTVPAGGNPLAGVRFFVDPQSEAAQAAGRYRAIGMIAREPGTARFGSFSITSSAVPTIGVAVSRYLTRAAAQQPGAVPLLATYRVVSGHCGHWSDPPAAQAGYHNFIESFAQGIGSYRAVLFLEEDALITSPCLTTHGLDVRMQELSAAINVLTANCPHLVVYLDAGAADALSARHAASLLERAGVAKIQGFFLNSTHFDWTSKEIRYGEQISRMTGGKHFVVNTGANGRGPLAPRNIAKAGNEVLCNPPRRGLGPAPTTSTGYANVDAFAWTSNPGESGGACVPGAPATGAFWPAYAEMLVRNADFKVR
jgi:endoglucanase